MKEFLFKPEQARTPVGVLSGGERGRLTLACAMARPSNLLVLDEPTNDLDLETLDLLQDMLAEYPGTVLLVSHDRDFLDRIVTSTLSAEGDGRWVEYAGGYSDMLLQRGAPDLGAPLKSRGTSSSPSRTAPRKLSFKDKHALETLPKQMEALAAERAAATGLASPIQTYTERIRQHSPKPAKNSLGSSVSLLKAEERWLELEMMREALEAS